MWPNFVQKGLPLLFLTLVVIGQLYYLPDRWAFLQETFMFARADEITAARLAYGQANYDLLEWTRQHTLPTATILLITTGPHTYGDPAYVLYHRAIYHLAPRSIWWAAPVPATRYPAWWQVTDLSEASLLALARQRQADTILAVGLARPPVAGPTAAYDETTHLIWLNRPLSLPARASTPNVTDLAGDNQGLNPAHRPPTLFGWLRIAGALLVIGLWGDWPGKILLNGWPAPLPLRLGLAWLLGSGLVSLLMFLLLWTGVSLTQTVLSLSLLGLTGFLLARTTANSRPPTAEKLLSPAYNISSRFTFYVSRLTPHSSLFTPHSSLFTLIILSQVTLTLYAALTRPLTDWDTWVNWAGKANLIVAEQTISPNLYNNPARLPTNMDYPLMLPLLEAWLYTWLGHIYEPGAGIIAFLFYGALLLIFYTAARRLVWSGAALGVTALLATTPRLERLAAAGLADPPLAALVLLVFLLLSYVYREIQAARSLFSRPIFPVIILTALATGLLPWLKNEGWLWFGLVLLSWGTMIGFKVRQSDLSRQQAVFLSGLFLLGALIIALPWPLFLALSGTQRFTFQPLSLATFLFNAPRLPVIGLEILKRLLNPYWNFIWLLVGFSLIIRRVKSFQTPPGWLIWPVFGYFTLISLTYSLSRFDPYLAHVNNSVERLAVQALPLALWWLIGQSVALGWVERRD